MPRLTIAKLQEEIEYLNEIIVQLRGNNRERNNDILGLKAELYESNRQVKGLMEQITDTKPKAVELAQELEKIRSACAATERSMSIYDPQLGERLPDHLL